MSQASSTVPRLKTAGRAIKGVAMVVMAIAWVTFWSLIIYSDLQAGNHRDAVTVAVLLVLLPAFVMLRGAIR